MSRTACKLIGEDIVYKHVHVYTRDLSVNRLLMRRAVIMAFVCVGEIITNVFSHIFSAALGWWTPGVGVDAIYRVGELVQMYTFTCVTRHFLLASKITIASSFFAIAYS